MMLIDSISFVGTNPDSQVRVRVTGDGRAEVTIDAHQQIILTIKQLRAVQSAFTRIIEGR